MVAKDTMVKWSDIAGYEKLKDEIREVVELPLTKAEEFRKMGLKPSKGILLYGPPGCSKTLTAKAIAHESSHNFIAIKGSDFNCKYFGDSEKKVREVFKKARQAAPSILFFDEIDAIAKKSDASSDASDRVLKMLLQEIDGMESTNDVIVLGKLQVENEVFEISTHLSNKAKITQGQRYASCAGKPDQLQFDLPKLKYRCRTCKMPRKKLSSCRKTSLITRSSFRSI